MPPFAAVTLLVMELLDTAADDQQQQPHTDDPVLISRYLLLDQPDLIFVTIFSAGHTAIHAGSENGVTANRAHRSNVSSHLLAHTAQALLTLIRTGTDTAFDEFAPGSGAEHIETGALDYGPPMPLKRVQTIH
jgi:hypothetical protein